MKRHDWAFRIIATIAFVLSAALAGCTSSQMSETTAESEAAPTSAQELYDLYSKNEDSDNYHMTMTCNMGMTIRGKRMDTTMVEEADIAGGAGHATTTAKAAGTTSDVEFYVEEDGGTNVVYMRSSNSGTWVKQNYGTAPLGDTTQLFADGNMYDSATFEETDDGYLVTFTGGGMESLSSQLDLSGSLGSDVQKALKDAFKDASLTVEFGKDCLPRTAKAKVDVPLDGTSVASVMSSMDLDLTIEMGNFGSIDPKSVAVPESVKKETSGQDTQDNALAPLIKDNKKDSDNTTSSKEAALERAESYLRWTNYSHDGLIKQLTIADRYSTEDATYAADNCGADWNEQAVGKAKSMLENHSYSRDGMIKFLEFDKFTHDQAVYGADNCGADWNEQALSVATKAIKGGYSSRDGLIDYLKRSGFTQEQAAYAAENCKEDDTEGAVKAATNRLKYSADSRTGLIKYLEKQGFTNEQATHAADNCGADWNEQAEKKAKQYKEHYSSSTSLSHEDMVALLKSDDFTEEEATHGADSVGL